MRSSLQIKSFAVRDEQEVLFVGRNVPMLLKDSISTGKWTPAAEADLCNRSVFDDLT